MRIPSIWDRGRNRPSGNGETKRPPYMFVGQTLHQSTGRGFVANYFLRFQMSLGLHCGLEVLAPTLSKVPIFVRQRKESSVKDAAPAVEEEEEVWVDDLEVQQDSASSDASNTPPPPQLQVDMVVCGPNDDSDGASADEQVAALKMIRMVNRIPLLDGAEAAACGLVQGLSNKHIWGSFGLSVAKSSSPSDDQDGTWVPTFEVQDSDQVAPFFQSQTHALWEAHQEDHDDIGDIQFHA